MGLELDQVASNKKHYGAFVCRICKGLASLDAVVTPCNHPFCHSCLISYGEQCLSENSTCQCPTCGQDLKANESNDKRTILSPEVPIQAQSLKTTQPLAYSVLLTVQVKDRDWIGDYQALHLHEYGHSVKSGLPPVHRTSIANGSVITERPSVFEDEASRAGTTTRGEATAAHHLRSLPQHTSEPGQVNLPELQRAMERCDKLKKQANAKFNRGDVEGARLLYSEALALISDFPIENDDVRIMIASLYSNRAVTFFRERILGPCVEDCDNSLELDPMQEKTYIRKWRALSAMGETDEATASLQQGLKVLPQSTKLQAELRKSSTTPATAATSQLQSIDGNQSIASLSKMSAVGYDLESTAGPSAAALERSERLKKQANAKFNKGEIEAARSLYTDALGCIPKNGKYNQEIKDSLSMLYSNRAVTFYRDRMYSESVADCVKAIELDPRSEKSYIRQSRALMGLDQVEAAYRALLDGSKTLPNSKKIADEIKKADFDNFNVKNSDEKKLPTKDEFDGGASIGSFDFNNSVGSFNYFIPASKSSGIEDLSKELEMADKLKRNANAKFNRGDIAGARLLYTEALGCLPDTTQNAEVRSCLAALYSNRAVTFFREKEFGPSISDCDKAIVFDPQSEKSYIRKARALTALFRLEDAVACFEEGLKVIPDSSKLQAELIKAKEEQEMGPNGESIVSGQQERDFNISMSNMNLNASTSSLQASTTFFISPPPKDTKSILGSVAEGASMALPYATDEDMEQAEKLKKQANAKLNKGDVAGARFLYGEGLDCLPQSPNSLEARELAASLYANRAVTFFREKKFASTVIDCDKSLELDPKHEKSFIRKWRALMALGNFDDAFKCLEDAAKMIPDSERLQDELSSAREQKDFLSSVYDLIANKDYEEAREMLLPSVKTSDNVSLWLAAAQADAYLGYAESALERVNKVLTFNPKHLEALQIRGYALFLSGEMDQGITLLKESLEGDIEHVYQDAFNLLHNCQKMFSAFSKGQARVKRGRYKEAVELFNSVMEDGQTLPVESPLYSLLLTERAEACLLSHFYEDALEDCIEAISLKEDNLTAWTVKIEVYFALGRLQEARDELGEVRKTWGAGNDVIQDAYKKCDFELRLQKADDHLIGLIDAVETGIAPDIPDGEPIHFNLQDKKSPAKTSKKSKTGSRRRRSSFKSKEGGRRSKKRDSLNQKRANSRSSSKSRNRGRRNT